MKQRKFLEANIQSKHTAIVRKFLLPILILFAIVVLCAGLCLNYSVSYLISHFNDVPLGQLLFHLHTPLDGTNISAFSDVIENIIKTLLVTISLFIIGYYLFHRFQKHLPYILSCIVLGIALIGNSLHNLDLHFDLKTYYTFTKMKTELYDKYYVDGRDIQLDFPDVKRNLIYIYLESMETTFADKKTGGAFEINLIPQLTQLSLENISFSDDGILNGGVVLEGSTYTMGALVAQTSGVTINTRLLHPSFVNETYESDYNIMPGAWTLGDVLHQQGYNQEFMCGSDGKFAGRASYFKGHGNYNVIDYYNAIEQGRIPEGYYVWWGFEDEKLFSLAKEDILRMASENVPFNFSMLTVDTHFTDGYYCELCENEYASQYSNVISCSDRQVADFIIWVQQQDFYENTTIVLAGDHLTMDSEYMSNMGVDNYLRKTYFTIINPPSKLAEKEQPRQYTTCDFYPTTLAALGVNIEGNRLGLGVNLFSDVPTLLEEFDQKYLNGELLKSSNLYTKKLLYNNNP